MTLQKHFVWRICRRLWKTSERRLVKQTRWFTFTKIFCTITTLSRKKLVVFTTRQNLLCILSSMPLMKFWSLVSIWAMVSPTRVRWLFAKLRTYIRTIALKTTRGTKTVNTTKFKFLTRQQVRERFLPRWCIKFILVWKIRKVLGKIM